jgi:hypothetical protein
MGYGASNVGVLMVESGNIIALVGIILMVLFSVILIINNIIQLFSNK